MKNSSSEPTHITTSQNNEDLTDDHKAMIDKMLAEDDNGTAMDIPIEKIKERFMRG